MRVDIYRRPEHHGVFSYMAVPEGKPIPEEATNTDWQLHAPALEIDEEAGVLTDYHIEHPASQIADKGYAITSLKDMGDVAEV